MLRRLIKTINDGGVVMKSVKPGRAPSGMSFIGSIVVTILGVFWTIEAFSMASDFEVGITFPLSGIILMIVGITQAVYHFKNATGENRFSEYDITDSSEEDDSADKWIKGGSNYCPYCGATINNDYSFCPKCGKAIK